MHADPHFGAPGAYLTKKLTTSPNLVTATTGCSKALSSCGSTGGGARTQAFDMLASDMNRHCDEIYSMLWRLGTSGVNSFALSWSNCNNWINPFGLIIYQVLSKLREDKASGTLVVPSGHRRH